MNQNNFSIFLKILIISILFAEGNLLKGADKDSNGKNTPNILIIIADDCTYNDLPLYGGKNAKTPNIDRLAKEGMLFNKAYLAEAMCQPCRSELYTGQYPMRNGCAWNHSSSRPEVMSIPHYLRDQGYKVGLSGKVHVKPQKVYPFSKIEGFDLNCVRNPTRKHETGGIKKFMMDAENHKFCMVVALVEPHVPWVMGDASKYPPKEIILPPNIADTPKTREAFSRYLAEITYMDGQVGDILDALEETGRADDTLVIFTSEQGSQFPGCKWTNWDTGLHTAFIARWPGMIKQGVRTNALIQYADVLPTLIEIAGGTKLPRNFDGESFFNVLTSKKKVHRKYVYGIHNNLPEGPSYPVRTVSDGKFRYIRNLKSKELFIEKHLMGWDGKGTLNNPYWATWVRASWNNKKTYNLVNRYMNRPPEELYQTQNDPYELNNIVVDDSYKNTKLKLGSELDRWMKAQADPGALQDTQEALSAARDGKHIYGPKLN